MHGRPLLSAHARALALAGLVLLAGCGGIAGERTTDTVTPAPVPTPEPPVVPGVTSEAIDAPRVVAGHQRALSNTSFTMESRFRASEPAGNASFLLETTLVSAADGRFLFDRVEPTQEVPGRVDATVIWWDGKRTVFRYSYGSGPASTFTIGQRAAIDVDRSDVLERVLAGTTVTGVSRLPAGGAELTGRITNRTSVPTAGVVEEPRNASLTARIRSDGLIEAIAVGYDGTYDGNRTDVRYTVAFEDVGATEVERPEWMTW